MNNLLYTGTICECIMELGYTSANWVFDVTNAPKIAAVDSNGFTHTFPVSHWIAVLDGTEIKPFVTICEDGSMIYTPYYPFKT